MYIKFVIAEEPEAYLPLSVECFQQLDTRATDDGGVLLVEDGAEVSKQLEGTITTHLTKLHTNDSSKQLLQQTIPKLQLRINAVLL